MKIYFSLIVLLACISLNAQDSTYKELLGKYKFPSGSVIEEAVVTWDNNILNFSSSAATSVLERIKGDTFNVVGFNGICVFKRDEAKKITGVHVDASGYVLDGVKDAAALNEFYDAAEAEKQERVKKQIQESIEYHKIKARKPFLALVYN